MYCSWRLTCCTTPKRSLRPVGFCIPSGGGLFAPAPGPAPGTSLRSVMRDCVASMEATQSRMTERRLVPGAGPGAGANRPPPEGMQNPTGRKDLFGVVQQVRRHEQYMVQSVERVKHALRARRDGGDDDLSLIHI